MDIGSLMSLGTGESWGARREGSLGSVGSLESEGSKKNLGSEGSKESGEQVERAETGEPKWSGKRARTTHSPYSLLTWLYSQFSLLFATTLSRLSSLHSLPVRVVF